MTKDERQAIYTSDDSIIEDGSWDFIGENTQQYLHSLHPYPARFIPQIPRKAISQYTKTGQTVFDPFSGCGTTILEAVISGRNAIGIDNNAVACLVSRAKTAVYSQHDFAVLTQLLDTIEELVNGDSLFPSIPNYNNIDYWFDKKALTELGKIKAAVSQVEGNANLLALAAFSSIIVPVSYQDSDTRYSRKEYEYLPGKAVSLFKKKLATSIKEARETAPLITGTASVIQCDGRKLNEVQPRSVDLIVTSPPYLNAYDYHKYHRHRLEWIDGDVEFARNVEIGKHDTFTKKGATPNQYFVDMGECFSQWDKVLAETGSIIIVIGDAIVSGQPVPVADKFVSLFADLNYTLSSRWVRNLDTSRKSFNQNARVNKEHILLFQRK